MTTTPEWTPAHIDQVRALVERLRHELAEHDDGVWVGIGLAIVTLVPSALDEIARLQADNARLRAVVEAARQVHTVGSTEERAAEDVWMQAFYGLHHALRAYDAPERGQS